MALPTPVEVIRQGYMTIECHIPNQCKGCAFDYIVPRGVTHLCDWAQCGREKIYIEDCDDE